MIDRQDILNDLIRDEGIILKPYKDSVGKLTIGIGRNLDDVGLTKTEAEYLCENDIGRSMADLDRNAPWWRKMGDNGQRALVNMCFNLGWPRLSGFSNMLAALRAGDYAKAADEALDSRWAKQVGPRAQRIADLLRIGGY
jgi:lysozyme